MKKIEIATGDYTDLFLEGSIDNVIAFLKSCSRQCKELGYKNIEVKILWNKKRNRFKLFGEKIEK